jgi:hypothetical protein
VLVATRKPSAGQALREKVWRRDCLNRIKDACLERAYEVGRTWFQDETNFYDLISVADSNVIMAELETPDDISYQASYMGMMPYLQQLEGSMDFEDYVRQIAAEALGRLPFPPEECPEYKSIREAGRPAHPLTRYRRGYTRQEFWDEFVPHLEEAFRDAMEDVGTDLVREHYEYRLEELEEERAEEAQESY